MADTRVRTRNDGQEFTRNEQGAQSCRLKISSSPFDCTDSHCHSRDVFQIHITFPDHVILFESNPRNHLRNLRWNTAGASPHHHLRRSGLGDASHCHFDDRRIKVDDWLVSSGTATEHRERAGRRRGCIPIASGSFNLFHTAINSWSNFALPVHLGIQVLGSLDTHHGLRRFDDRHSQSLFEEEIRLAIRPSCLHRYSSRARISGTRIDGLLPEPDQDCHVISGNSLRCKSHSVFLRHGKLAGIHVPNFRPVLNIRRRERRGGGARPNSDDPQEVRYVESVGNPETKALIYAAWLVWSLPIISVPFVPLLGAINGKIRNWFTVCVSALTAITGLYLAITFSSLSSESSGLWIPSFNLRIQIEVDGLSVLLSAFISFLSFLIVLYSIGYMKSEKGQSRYYSLILLFIGSMLGLVMAGNLVQLYFFWELVGICSAFLIAFYNDKPEARRAGLKAFVVTRFGDIALFIAVLLVLSTLGRTDFDSLNVAVGNHSISTSTTELSGY